MNVDDLLMQLGPVGQEFPKSFCLTNDRHEAAVVVTASVFEKRRNHVTIISQAQQVPRLIDISDNQFVVRDDQLRMRLEMEHVAIEHFDYLLVREFVDHLT